MKTARTQTATRSITVWKKPLNAKQPRTIRAVTTTISAMRSTEKGREMSTMRAMPTMAVSTMHSVEISPKSKPRNLPTRIATTSATTIEIEAGSERMRTFARKLPFTRSLLGSSARTNDGMPMIAVEMSVIWMGMKGYGGMTMQTKVSSIE